MLMKLNAARTGKEPDQSFRQDRSDRNFQSRREGEFDHFKSIQHFLGRLCFLLVP